MAKRYMLLGQALDAFKQEIADGTPVRLPFDVENINDLSVTLVSQTGKLYAGIQQAIGKPPEALTIIDGDTRFAKFQPVEEAPQVGNAEHCKWYAIDEKKLPKVANYMLELETREKAIAPNQIKAMRERMQREGGRQ